MPWIGAREKRVLGSAAIRAGSHTGRYPAPMGAAIRIIRAAVTDGSMAGVAPSLSEDEISDLAYYIARVK